MRLSRIVIYLTALALPPLLGWATLTQPILLTDTVETSPQANPDTLEKHVKQLVEVLPPRDGDDRNLLLSANYIAEQLNPYADDVERQVFDVWGISYQNVIARFAGAPGNTDPKIVIGAHYDTAEGTPGADDNTSGIAGLLELARLFAQQPPARPIELVAYTLEEPPYFRTKDMGSYHHAKQLREQQQDVELMICLEMIGYFSDQENSQTYPIGFMESFYPTTGNFIALVSNVDNIGTFRAFKSAMLKHTQIPVNSVNAPAIVPGIDFSDHRNYWIFDYPAIMVTDTAFYRNHNYHTAGDTPDTLDYQKMAQVIDAVFYSVIAFGD